MTKKPTYEELENQLAKLKKQIEFQKLSENLNKPGEGRFGKLMKNNGDVIVITDSEGIITYTSLNIEKHFGWQPEDIIGKSIFDNILDADLDIRQKFTETPHKDSDGAETIQVHFKCFDNCYKWAEITYANLLHDADINGILLNCRDISIEMQMAENLEKSKQEYWSTIENLHVGIVVYDNDSRVLYSNQEASNILGITTGLMSGKDLDDQQFRAVHEDLSPIKSEDYPVKKVITTKNPLINYVMGLIRPDKEAITWVNINAIPVFHAGNILEKVNVYFIDITEQKQSEKALILYSERNKALLKLNEMKGFKLHEIMDYVLEEAVRLTQSKIGYLAFLNEDESMLTMYSWSKTAMMECATTEQPREYLVEKTGLWGECVRQRRPVITNDYAAENPLKKGHPEGHVKLIRHMNIPVFDNSKIVLVAGVGNKFENYDQSDVEQLTLLMEGMWQLVERKRTEYALREKELFSQQIIENAPFGVHHYELTDDNKLIFSGTNPAADIILGIKNFQFIGKPIEEAFPSLAQTHIPETYRKIARHGGLYHEEELNFEQGVIAGSFEIHAFQTSPMHVTIFFSDITERKRAELELIQAKEKAEESDRLKSAFLANMSHEIRTPMNGILGFADLLKEPKLSGEEQQHYISIIEESGARMLNIINDIISISKIESGQTEVSLSEVNPNDLLQYLYSFFLPEAEKKCLLLYRNTKSSSNEIIINTDKEKVLAVLINLVKNAIKYTPSGFVEFGYEIKDNMLEFFVKDSGIGIQEKHQKVIFERFRQVSESIDREFEGAGLGLSISKAYIEMLGGKIWVESKPGFGSTFYFTLPLTDISKNHINMIDSILKSEIKNENKLIGLNILIVEDDKISKKLLIELTSKFGKKVLQATNGIEAIELCKKHTDLDLILLDIQMPEMDGYETCRQIRMFNKNIIIIAQTAYALEGDKEKAIAAGCNDYIAKPINPEELNKKILKYITR